MIRRIILDVESAKTVEQVGGWGNVAQLGIGVAAVYREDLSRYVLYGEGDRSRLQDAIFKADEICGYNIWGFDLPLIFQRGKKEFWESDEGKRIGPRVYDLFRLVCMGLRRSPDAPPSAGFDVDTLSLETLGEGKSGDGKDAPGMYQRGEFCRLHSYCMNDVRLESGLVRFAKSHGYLLGLNAARVYIARREAPYMDSAGLIDPLWNS